MSDQELRLACLQIAQAVEHGKAPEALVEAARAFYRFARGDEPLLPMSETEGRGVKMAISSWRQDGSDAA